MLKVLLAITRDKKKSFYLYNLENSKQFDELRECVVNLALEDSTELPDGFIPVDEDTFDTSFVIIIDFDNRLLRFTTRILSS